MKDWEAEVAAQAGDRRDDMNDTRGEIFQPFFHEINHSIGSQSVRYDIIHVQNLNAPH